MNNTSELVEKNPTDKIYVTGANVEVAKVGFTDKNMKLIREEVESVKFLVEQKNGKKSLYIEGVFLQGDIKNRNGRMYPMETLRKEVARYNESNIQSGRALGELGHPDGPTVNLDRVSHKIVSLRESGSNFIGKLRFLAHPWVRSHLL